MSKFENVKVDILKDETLSKSDWYQLRYITFDYTGSAGRTVTLKREVYDRGNGATILLFDPKREMVILVRQFRIPPYLIGHSGWLIEAPAGLLEGEHPEEVIRREVMEETGYAVHAVRPIFRSFMSPGAVTEIIHFFVALIDSTERTGAGGGLADEHEDIEVMEIGLDAAMAMIESGDICDAKTIMLLQWAALNRGQLKAEGG